MKTVGLSGRKATGSKLLVVPVILALAAVCILTPSIAQAENRAANEGARLSIAVLPAAAPSFTLTRLQPDLSAKAGATGLPGGTSYTTRTIYPDLKIPFAADPITALPFSLHADEKIGGNWKELSGLTYSAHTGDHYLYATDIAQKQYGQWAHLPGDATYRLRQGTITAPDGVSPEFTVSYVKTPTTFVVGSAEKAHIITYRGKKYYEVKKKKIEVRFAKPYADTKRVSLQQQSGSKWIEKSYINLKSGVDLLATVDIVQTTAICKYRLFVPGDAYVTGGVSPTFTVSGKKQTPRFTLKYSASSQKYNRTGVKISVSMFSSSARSGKITIYDGKKALKTMALKSGKATWTLPKKLKKGTHRIKVKYTPTRDDKTFYTSRTSTVKKIRVV